MSLSKLPNSLIAKIADYLDYSDICNLMETNKKNYCAIKGYKKDKIKLYSLTFTNYHNRRATMKAFDYTYGMEYLFKNWNELEENVEKVKQVLDKCSSIDQLEIVRFVFNNELFNVLMNTKAKIGNLTLRWEDNFIMEEILKLGRKFNVVFIFWGVLPDAVIINDKFLSQILPRSTIELLSNVVMGTIDAPMNITDVTLNALISGRKVQGKFFIGDTHNLITIKKVTGVIKILIERNEDEDLDWNLGMLQPDQLMDADQSFGENGGMRGICDVTVTLKTNSINYSVSFLDDEWGNHKCNIHFAVALP